MSRLPHNLRSEYGEGILHNLGVTGNISKNANSLELRLYNAQRSSGLPPLLQPSRPSAEQFSNTHARPTASSTAPKSKPKSASSWGTDKSCGFCAFSRVHHLLLCFLKEASMDTDEMEAASPCLKIFLPKILIPSLPNRFPFRGDTLVENSPGRIC